MKGLTDKQCENYARCGYKSCNGNLGKTCPSTPVGKYVDWDQVPEDKLFGGIVDVGRCDGDPKDKDYKGARYCKAEINNQKYCI